MPLYMDVHDLGGGVTLDDVAKAHLADLQTQGKHDVRYLRYWVNEERRQGVLPRRGTVAEAASTVHREAHGLVADEVLEVQEGS